MNHKVKRRDFIQLLSTTALITAGSPLVTLAANPDQKNLEAITFLTKPYLQNPSHEAMSIFWLTDQPAFSWIEFKTGHDAPIKAFKITHGMAEANDRIHKVRLKQLKPGTNYTYQIYAKEILQFEPYKLVYGETIATEPYTFTTPEIAPKEFAMLVLNDIHDRPKSFPELLALNKERPYDFVFLNGDMFDYQTDEKQIIDHLLNPCGSVFSSSKPFMFIRGNHETRGKFSRNLSNYFENKDNGNYFSFTYGPVYFITLDTGEDKEDDHPAYAGLADFDRYREEQAIWLETQLKSKAFRDAKFKVVLMHIPHYHSGDWHGTMHCRKLFGPLFNKYKIDLLVSGHTHQYGIHLPQEGHNFPIVIGGGPKESQRTLIRLHANQKQLTVEMTKDDGQVVGNYIVRG